MSAATIVTEAFGEEAVGDLYELVLGVPRDATAAQIKKAYHKKALKLHPDKINQSTASQDEIEQAKRQFQAVSVAYQILSNEETRKEYDATGELVDEENFVSGADKDGFAAWEEYFKSIFGSINFSDIDKFANKYQRSDEERDDVLKYYKSCKGDLNKMLHCVMCSSKEDKQRWVKDYIEPAIKQKKVPRFEALAKTLDVNNDDDDDDYNSEEDEDYELQESEDDEEEEEMEEEDESEDNDNNKDTTTDENTSSGKKSKSRPPRNGNNKPHPKSKSKPKSKSPKPSKKTKVSKAAQDMIAEDLIAKIRGKQGGALAQREQAFNKMMDNMEARYAGKGKGRGGKKSRSGEPEISDAEFEKIQARLEKNRRRK